MQQGTVTGESATSADYDQKQLDKISPTKIEDLDSVLAEALTLYYDGKYGRALPIFNKIATEVETMDILWWIGTSAQKTGDLNKAAEKFRKMLAVDPNLHRVRLELAAIYFELGRYEEARKELQFVKAAKPPPPEEVLNNIDRLLAAIDERTRRVLVNVRFSQGLQWDTNVSSGPDKKELSGGSITLESDTQKLRDWATVTNLSANALARIGDIKGLMWNTGVDFYKSVYFNYGKYNYQLTDINTGPWWTGRQDILKIPVGFSSQDYGSDHLSYIYHIDPSYEHYFSPYFSLRASHIFSKETYYDISKNSALDNTTRRYELSPNFFLFNRQHIIMLAGGYETSDAELKKNSYISRYGSVSYFTRFPSKTDLFLRYQFGEKSYKDVTTIYNEERVDRRHTYTAVLSQEIYKNYFASFTFNLIDNNSNLELYDFDKETYTLNLGFYF